jgi:hypothetical protein
MSSFTHSRTGRTTAVIATLAAAGLLSAAPALAASRDTDGDGMPNRWELNHHLNPRVANARMDPDHDGLRNLAEYRLGVRPHDEDSDGDGADDGDEVRDGYASTDVDDADTNDNGVEDGDQDADHDGIDNEDEDDATETCLADDDDKDSDGIDNEDENDFGTRVNDADSDDDGVEDGDEDSDGDEVEDEDSDDDADDDCDDQDEDEDDAEDDAADLQDS